MNHVYLAGPITWLTFEEGQDWRQKLVDRFAEWKIEARSPLRGKSYLKNSGTLTREHDYGEFHPLSSDKGIVTRDREDVRTAGLVFANFLGASRVSSGTCIELGWADAWRIPTIAVMEPEGNAHDGHMVRGVTGFIMHDIDSAFDLALTLMGYDLDLGLDFPEGVEDQAEKAKQQT